MGNKNQSLQAKRQAKAKTRQKKVQQRATVARNKEQRLMGEMQREARNVKVSDRGVLGTAEFIHKTRQKTKSKSEEITNLAVLEGIQEVIPKLLSIHATVEIVCELQKEGKVTLNEEQTKLVDQFDERVVKVGEDIVAIQTFIDADKEPEDYMAVFISYLDKLALLFEKELSELFDEVLKPYEVLVNDYVAEHKFEGESSFDFSMRYHTNRIDVVAPKYRTIEALEIPEEPSEELKETNALNASPVTC